MKNANASVTDRQLGETRSLYEAVSAIVSQCADDERFLISPVEEHDGYEVEYVGKGSEWRTGVYIEDEPDKHKIVVYSLLGISIPLAMRSQLAELITRINFDKDEGESTYLAMNMDDGELVIFTSLLLMDGELTGAMLEKMLSSNLMVIEGYTSAIMKVIYCDVTPSAAMKTIHDEMLAEKTLH